jgi:lipoprotein-releasing system permease protein
VSGFVLGILAAGVLALVAGVVLFVGFRFERFVGVRYLARMSVSAGARVGLYAAVAATAVGAGLFAVGGEADRGIQTAGVILTLQGTLGVLVFVLLRMFSVFTTVATMGVVLGVASLVVVLAVTSGFEREFKEKVLAVNAHLIVTDYGVEPDMDKEERKAEEFMRKLRGLPHITRMSKFSFSAGEVMIGKVGANLKGVDLSAPVPELERAVTAGRVQALAAPATCPHGDGPAGRMLLGAELQRKLRAKLGDCIPVLVPFSGMEPDAPPKAFWFKVVGTFQLGFHEYDARLAFISLEDARRLGSARHSVFGVEVRFDDPYLAMKLEEEVERRLGPEPRVIDWRTLNNNLFMALSMQKLIIAIVLGFIIVVAAFNIVASLMLIVLSKTREIAILSSMGARSMALLRVFVVSGSFIGFVGTGLGILYGLVVCGLARLYGYPLDPKVYLIAELPVEVSPQELLFVAATTQLICFAATLYPALRAARLRVVEGLRYT